MKKIDEIVDRQLNEEKITKINDFNGITLVIDTDPRKEIRRDGRWTKDLSQKYITISSNGKFWITKDVWYKMKETIDQWF